MYVTTTQFKTSMCACVRYPKCYMYCTCSLTHAYSHAIKYSLHSPWMRSYSADEGLRGRNVVGTMNAYSSVFLFLYRPFPSCRVQRHT